MRELLIVIAVTYTAACARRASDARRAEVVQAVRDAYALGSELRAHPAQFPTRTAVLDHFRRKFADAVAGDLTDNAWPADMPAMTAGPVVIFDPPDSIKIDSLNDTAAAVSYPFPHAFVYRADELRRRTGQWLIIASGLHSVPVVFQRQSHAERDSLLRTLERRWRQWKDLGLQDYDFAVDEGCFCGRGPDADSANPRIAQVRQGRLVTTRDTLGRRLRRRGWTVDAFFHEGNRLLRDTLAYEAVMITFDSTRGFPNKIIADPRVNITDDHFWRMAELRPAAERRR